MPGERDSEPQPPSDPSVGSLCHPCVTTTRALLSVSILETSATALCGTTGTCAYTYSYTFSNQLRPNRLVCIKLLSFSVGLSASRNNCRAFKRAIDFFFGYWLKIEEEHPLANKDDNDCTNPKKPKKIPICEPCVKDDAHAVASSLHKFSQ